MKEAGRRGDNHYSHFGPQANLSEELEKTFATYSESGGGRTRTYIHDALEADQHNGEQPEREIGEARAAGFGHGQTCGSAGFRRSRWSYWAALYS